MGPEERESAEKIRAIWDMYCLEEESQEQYVQTTIKILEWEGKYGKLLPTELLD